MKITYRDILLETINEMSYTPEETEKYRIVIGTLIDTTLSKPTLDVNTFLDPKSEFTKEQYTWFRDNPDEYIEAYSDLGGTYGPVRDPKETTLLYYLYRGTYQDSQGKWHIGQEENIDDVVKEIRNRAMAFVDAIGDYQGLIDVFFEDWNNVKKFTEQFSKKSEQATAISSFMSKDSPGEFEKLKFSKFRSGAMYGDTTTKGIAGTRDHMYKSTKELKNIPEEHKVFFTFEYMWLACYNLAQEDGLKPSNKKASEKLTAQLYADNYRNGLTTKESKSMFGASYPVSGKLNDVSYMTNILLNSILNDDRVVGLLPKPVSKMTEEEIVTHLLGPFDDILEKTKQALQVEVEPTTMISLLRIKDKVPKILIDMKKTKYKRTIKGLEMAGYLNPDGSFTSKVKSDKPQKMQYDDVKNFEEIVRQISVDIKKGLVQQYLIDKMRNIYNYIPQEQVPQLLEILKKYNVNSNTIKQATINYTDKIEKVSGLLYSIIDSQEAGRPISKNIYNQINTIMISATPEEKEDIVKLLKFYKNKGAV